VIAHERLGHALRRVAARLLAALRAVDAPDAAEEQAEVVVELGRGAGGRPGGAHGVLLLERDGGPHVLDAVHVGAIHPLEEHAGVGRERLHVPPLPFGEERVERERRLARSGHPRDHRDLVVGDRERDVLEIVLPGSLDAEPRRLRHSNMSS
jgi:hypothetical protein